MSASRDPAFFEAMASEGVVPLKRQDRANLRPGRRPRPDPSYQARRLAAAGGEEGQPFAHPNELLHPLDPIEWKRDGVQNGVYRNLRLGRYTYDARLDLMKRPVVECAEELIDFVRQCCDLGIRTVLISFGRSRYADSHPNLIKSCLAKWLPGFEEVMAFHSAQPEHGGTGAIYVLLRKNEQQRLNNLEQHQRRRNGG